MKNRFYCFLSLFLTLLIISIVFFGCPVPYEDESKEKDEESHTYNVLYKGNGADGGEVPVDSNDYPEDQIVTVAFAGTMSSTG